MKPEVSKGVVLDGKPNLTRVKRIGRSVVEAVGMLPKSAGKLEDDRQERLATSRGLEKRGFSFVHALRSSFGESLRGGLVVRPTAALPHTITVKAESDDTALSHRTAADIAIQSGEGHLTRLRIGATEPTIGAKRMAADVSPPTASIRVIDPTDPSKSYGISDFNTTEQEELVAVADQAFAEVELACDQGNCEVYAQV